MCASRHTEAASPKAGGLESVRCGCGWCGREELLYLRWRSGRLGRPRYRLCRAVFVCILRRLRRGARRLRRSLRSPRLRLCLGRSRLFRRLGIGRVCVARRGALGRARWRGCMLSLSRLGARVVIGKGRVFGLGLTYGMQHQVSYVRRLRACLVLATWRWGAAKPS